MTKARLRRAQTDDKGQFFGTVLCFCVNLGIIARIYAEIAENR